MAGLTREALISQITAGGMQSDDSEEDDYNLDEEDEEDALRYILNADDGNLRGYQMLRGQLDTTKRVATKKALRELQSVQISDLPEKERSKFCSANSLSLYFVLN